MGQGTNSFGIDISSSVNNSEELTDLIFGGASPIANPSDITKIDDEDPEEKPQTKEPVIELSADDVLNGLEDEEDTSKTSKKPEEKQKEETPAKEDESSDDVFSTLSKNLVDLGIFTQEEDEELPKTAEEFKDKWIAERQNQVNSDIYNFLMSKHGEEGYKIFNDIFVNGVDPREYLAKYVEVSSFKEMDLSSEPNQEKVVRESLRRQGLKEDLIDKKLQKMKDYGDLEEEASIAHELLVAQEERDLEEMAREKAEEEHFKKTQKAQYQANLQKILSEKLKTKEFDGIPVTDKVVREIYDYLDTEKWQLKNGDKLTDFDKELLDLRKPENLELRIKLALLLKNKLDLSKLKTSLLSKETSKIFTDLTIKEKINKRTQTTPVSNDFFSGLR